MINERTFKASDAQKLEDPERLLWLPPEEVADALSLDAGMAVADIGAGTGYFSIPLACRIGPAGRVHAVDLQREMLDILRGKLSQPGAPGNIELTIGTATQTGLPDGNCDLVFLANIWHELDNHAATLAEAARILKPNGRVAILDWRSDVSQPPGPPVAHRIGADRAAATLKDSGWNLSRRENSGKFSYLLVATSPPARTPSAGTAKSEG